MNSVQLQNTKSTHKKSVVFLYTKNKLSKKEIGKAIPFTIVSERINY